MDEHRCSKINKLTFDSNTDLDLVKKHSIKMLMGSEGFTVSGLASGVLAREWFYGRRSINSTKGKAEGEGSNVPQILQSETLGHFRNEKQTMR